MTEKKIIPFPLERTKAFKQGVDRLRKATDWWWGTGEISEAERQRELHRQAMGYLPRKDETEK